MNRILLISISIVTALFVAACERPETTPSTGMGSLENVILKGTDLGWTGHLDNGYYTLTNASDTGAIKYFYGPYHAEQAGNRTVTVKVNVQQASNDGRAGLLYGFDPSQRSYYAVVVSAQHQLEVYRRDKNGFALRTSTSFSPNNSGFTQITITESGKTMAISVNGKEVTSMQSAGTGKGATGILAMGLGQFVFTDYIQSQLGSAHAPIAHSPEPINNQITSGALTFSDQQVLDVSRNHMPAYSVFVPKNWTLNGKFEYIPAFHNVPYFGTIDVKAPNGRSFTFLPLAEFTYSDFAQLNFMQPYEGRPAFRMPANLADIMTTLLQSAQDSGISNVRIISEQPVPELIDNARTYAQNTLQQIHTANQQSGPYGEKQVYQIDARKLVVQYAENGRQMESTTYATMTNYAFVQPSGAVRIAKWNVLNAITMAGPIGSEYLDDPELAAVARSLRINPDWSYALDQWSKGVRELAIRKGMAKAAAANSGWRNTRSTQSEDVLDISFNGWKSRNATSDRSQSQLINSIHERTTYNLPGSGTVNLPAYYQNAYTDGQGNYVLHNSALYNINGDTAYNSRDWVRIESAH